MIHKTQQLFAAERMWGGLHGGEVKLSVCLGSSPSLPLSLSGGSGAIEIDSRALPASRRGVLH